MSLKTPSNVSPTRKRGILSPENDKKIPGKRREDPSLARRAKDYALEQFDRRSFAVHFPKDVSRDAAA